MGSVHELDFSERRDERRECIGDERPAREVEEEYPPRRVAESGMTGGEVLNSWAEIQAVSVQFIGRVNSGDVWRQNIEDRLDANDRIFRWALRLGISGVFVSRLWDTEAWLFCVLLCRNAVMPDGCDGLRLPATLHH